MKIADGTLPFSQHELRRFAFPVTVTGIAILAFLLFEGLGFWSSTHPWLSIFAAAGIIHIVLFDRIMKRSHRYQVYARWINPIISGFGLGILPYLLPDHLSQLFHILSVLSILGIAISAGRGSAYINIATILLVSLGHFASSLQQASDVVGYLAPFAVYTILVESMARMEEVSQQHIHRLETINKVTRQIMMSLDTEQTISLLNATIQNALEADTYYVGLVKNGDVHLDLFYDDGEYFNGTRVPLQGTLSGWVIQNQKELFLPDLNEDTQLDGVGTIIIGKDKTSRSWMGVPLISTNVTGVIALASYRPNAFSAADMKLLSTLAHPITLALDNTIRHAQVEEQARLDSMTGVYNHAYFLENLTRQAEEALESKDCVALIMLDIDFFKQYNDTYGHLVGDRILNTLCASIKQHIKRNDAVGRWGGEEFIISLANATGEQAIQVARRISETMSGLRVEDRDGKTLPVPTVSQGIAIFPAEADEIFRLIDLADRRLYVAKDRGRNQIEPHEGFWVDTQGSLL